jgi:hypothetical protein
MRLYNVLLNDGTSETVEAPENATREQLAEAINRKRVGPSIYEAYSKEAVDRRRTKLTQLRSELAEAREKASEAQRGSFSRGLDIGTDLVAQATGSGLEGIGSLLGLEGLEEYGAEVALENEADIQRKSRYQTKFDDIEGAEDFFSYLGGVAAESAPATAAGIAGGIAAAAAAPVIGVGAVAAGIAGATLANLPFFYGMNRERQKEAIEQGFRTEISEGAAFLTALPQALLDGIVDRLLVGGVSKLGVTEKALTGGGIFTRSTKGAGLGAVVEAPTEIGQQILERAQAGLPLDNEEALAEYREAGIAGGLLGGAIRGTTSAAGIGIDTDDTSDTTPTPTPISDPDVGVEAADDTGGIASRFLDPEFVSSQELEGADRTATKLALEEILARDPTATREEVKAKVAADPRVVEAAQKEREEITSRLAAGAELTEEEISQRMAAVTDETLAATTETEAAREATETGGVEEAAVETAPEVETEAQPAPERPITAEDLKTFGIRKGSKAAKFVGQDLNNAEVRSDFKAAVGKLKNSLAIQDNIARTLENERQAQVTEVTEESSGVSVPSDIQGAPEPEGDGDTASTVESGRGTVGDVDDSSGRPATGTGRSDPALAPASKIETLEGMGFKINGREGKKKKQEPKPQQVAGVEAPTVTELPNNELEFKFGDTGPVFRGKQKEGVIDIEGAPEITAFSKNEAVRKLQTKVAGAGLEAQAGRAIAGQAELPAVETEETVTPTEDVVEGISTKREVALSKEDTGGEAVLSRKELMQEARAMGLSTAEAKEYTDAVLAGIEGLNLDVGELYLLGRGVKGLDAPLPSNAVTALQAGDIKSALETVAKSTSNKDIRQIARKLIPLVGTTRVRLARLQENLPENASAIDRFLSRKVSRITEGSPVFGQYYPGAESVLNQLSADATIEEARIQARLADEIENTIVLNQDTAEGMSVVTLLHEMTHAATINTLAQPSNPVTTQLRTIYNSVKEQLQGLYGSESLEEFVAEAFSNPMFQQRLARINIKGEQLSAFDRFKNAIRRLFRLPIKKDTKPVSKEVNALIEQILAPAPQYRGLGTISNSSSPREVAAIGEALKNRTAGAFSKTSREVLANRIKGIFSGPQNPASVAAKRVVGGFLPNSSIGDWADSLGLDGATDVLEAIENQRGDLSRSEQVTRRKLLPILQWGNKATKEIRDRFNDVVYISTIEGVDPSKDLSAYTGKKLTIYKELRREFDKLGPDGRRAYTNLRDFYKYQYNQLLKALEGRIDELEAPQEVKTNLKNELLGQLLRQAKEDPYFPLTRKGTYFLAVKDPKAQANSAVFSFENNGDRNMAIDEFTEMGMDVEIFDPNDSTMYTGDSVPPAFVANVLRTLDAQVGALEPNQKIGYEAAREQITKLFIQSLPESSFAKGLQKRKKTEGYDKDALEAARTKGYDLARQASRIKNSAIIQSKLTSFLEKSKGGDVEVVREIRERAKFAMNPPKDNFAKNLNRMAFLWTIGFNASSALVNLSQIPLFAYPMLAGKYGYANTSAAIKDAGKLFVGTPLNQTQETLFGGTRNARSIREALKGRDKLKNVMEATQDKAQPSLENYYTVTESDGQLTYAVREDLDLSQEMKTELENLVPLVRLAARRGQLGSSFIAETLSVDTSGRDISRADFITNMSALMFHTAEVMNRQTTLVAAYKLALDKATKGKDLTESQLREAEQKAAADAVYETQQINGGANLETGPRFARSGVGRVALMYKNYGITMYYKMLKTAWEGTKAAYGGDTEAAKVAFKQLAGVHMSALLLAGVQGLPLYGAATMIYDMLVGDESEEDFETFVRRSLDNEMLYKGVLSEVTGLDVSKRVALTNLLFEADRFNSNPSPEESFMHFFGGPAWSVGSRAWESFEDLWRGEDMERAFEGMAPGAIRNAYRALRRYPRDEGILTRRGDPMYDDITGGQLFAQLLGFPPTEYMNNMEESSKAKRMNDAAANKRRRLLKRYYVAMRFGDFMEADNIRLEMAEFSNSRAVQQDPKLAITPETIERSMKAHERTTTRMHNGVLLSPATRATVEAEGFF